MLCISSIPPGDGLQMCPKHVEVDWRNKLCINIASSWFSSHKYLLRLTQITRRKIVTLNTAAPAKLFQKFIALYGTVRRMLTIEKHLFNIFRQILVRYIHTVLFYFFVILLTSLNWIELNSVWVRTLPGPMHLGLKTGPLCLVFCIKLEEPCSFTKVPDGPYT